MNITNTNHNGNSQNSSEQEIIRPEVEKSAGLSADILIEKTPAAIVFFKGKSITVELINAFARQLWNVQSEQVLHKPLEELPDTIREFYKSPLQKAYFS